MSDTSPFPPNPNPGDSWIANNGAAYIWTGEMWAAHSAPQTHPYLPLSGGALSGELILAADPVQALDAATKQYVDAHVGGGGGSGTVTQINTGTGLTGGPISTTGTIAASFGTTGGTVAQGNDARFATIPGASSTTPAMDGTAAVGTGTTYARADHVHPVDTSRYAASNPSGYQTAAQVTTALAPYAPLASPTFTGTVTIPSGASIAGYAPLASPAFTGTPSLPTGTTGVTQTAGNSSTALATTAFVATSFAPLAAPVFTGDARAVTASYGDNDTSISTTAFVQSAVAPAANNVGRNLVTNGTFVVAQRGTGSWTANANYTADRWAINLSTDVVSVSIAQLTDADRAAIGDESAIQVLQNAFTGNAAAGAFNAIYQPIENLLRLSGKTVTVSFWARRTAGTATRIGVLLYQNFGTGGSPSAGVFVPAQAVTISTTWARYTATFSVPSFAGKVTGTNGDHSTWLYLPFSSGSTNNAAFGNIGVQSGTIQLWGVQLEIGSVATPLDAGGSPAMILAECERFFQTGTIVLAAYQNATQTVAASTALNVAMRATPTCAFTTGSNTNVSGLSVSALNNTGVQMVGTAQAAAVFIISQSFSASADL